MLQCPAELGLIPSPVDISNRPTRLGVMPGSLGGADFLVDPFEVSVDSGMLVGITALLALPGSLMVTSRPSWLCRITNIGLYSNREENRGQDSVWGSEDSSRWSVRRVMLVGDVPHLELCSCDFDDVMESSENLVGLDVLAGAFPPPFNNSCVVAVALEMLLWAIYHLEKKTRLCNLHRLHKRIS